MKTAFTLVEILIVVAILGIIAAVVIPEFQNSSQLAKESAAKKTLQILRTAIERYANSNNGIPPGYANVGEPGIVPLYIHLVQGGFIPEFPSNPFNGLDTFLIVDDAATFPQVATGRYGWVYQPLSKKIALDWTGTDSQGVSFFDY